MPENRDANEKQGVNTDWRDKELVRKHAKLLKARRENEILKGLLEAYGVPIPEPLPIEQPDDGA